MSAGPGIRWVEACVLHGKSSESAILDHFISIPIATEIDAGSAGKGTAAAGVMPIRHETVEIYDADGNIIWQQNHPNIQDVVITPRRDFFIPLEIKLPPDTLEGQYTLKVRIEDKVGLTTDQRRMAFTIGNP